MFFEKKAIDSKLLAYYKARFFLVGLELINTEISPMQVGGYSITFEFKNTKGKLVFEDVKLDGPEDRIIEFDIEINKKMEKEKQKIREERLQGAELDLEAARKIKEGLRHLLGG